MTVQRIAELINMLPEDAASDEDIADMAEARAEYDSGGSISLDKAKALLL